MRAARVIPCLDVTGGRVVKGVNFVSLRDAGDHLVLSVKAQPRASRSELAGLHGAELKIKVAAPPVDSAANEALIALLALVLGTCLASLVPRAPERFAIGLSIAAAPVVAWALLLVQLFAILGPGFWGLLAPAGRYLFPVLAPMLVLLWVGIVGVGSSVRHSYAAIALIATVALLDAVGFAEVLMRAYVPIILGGSGS